MARSAGQTGNALYRAVAKSSSYIMSLVRQAESQRTASELDQIPVRYGSAASIVRPSARAMASISNISSG